MDSPRNVGNEKIVTDEDVLPIDLTLQRKSLPSSLRTPASASTYICPICSEEQLTLDRFVDHVTTHRWKKSLVASHERSWLLLAKSSLLKSSRRLKFLRRSRKRHRESKQFSSMATRCGDKQPITTDFVEKEGQVCFHCPICPAFQRITGIQAAVNHFENFHMQIVVVCTICGMWFSNHTMFVSHVSVVHLRMCPENVAVSSLPQPLLLSPPPPTATTSAPTAGDSKGPQQLIDPVVASILFSGLLLSTHSTLFADSASQIWKDSDFSVTVANESEENSPQSIAENESQTRQVKVVTTKTPSKLYTQQQQQHPQLSVPFSRYSPNYATPVILYDHPLQRLLPPHVAVALDRSAVAKICHYCFKEFADEMAVLKHQVLVHRLEETTAENSA
eukprot:TsM_000855600 transcript=TsM_000855600 gene=TsM_000855600